MKGSCLCGEVQFELNLDNINMYQCHCEQCRKQTGTASSCGAVVKEESFSWLSGESCVSKWEKSTGFTSHFCNVCGSSVPNKFRGNPFYWVPVGALDSENIATVANLFLCEKANWSNVISSENSYETKPSIESLVSMLVNNNA
ncbi:GFA family protein [Aurantivibrio plasticivorans]